MDTGRGGCERRLAGCGSIDNHSPRLNDSAHRWTAIVEEGGKKTLCKALGVGVIPRLPSKFVLRQPGRSYSALNRQRHGN